MKNFPKKSPEKSERIPGVYEETPQGMPGKKFGRNLWRNSWTVSKGIIEKVSGEFSERVCGEITEGVSEENP